VKIFKRTEQIKPEEQSEESKTKRAKPRQRRIRMALSSLIIVCGVSLCIAFAFYALYPAARDYYIASVKVNSLQNELDAVNARNEKIEEQIAMLKTPEGIEDRARLFGWTKAGEQAVNITGLPLETSSTVLPPDVAQGAAANKTELAEEARWWTDFLDAFFAVPKPEPPEKPYDPFG
jgi:cell division protein FtsB